MTMRGGATEEMRQMAKDFAANAEAIREAIKTLDGWASRTDIWTGPGADRFRGEWQGARKSFNTMVGALHDASRGINTYATNIDAATR